MDDGSTVRLVTGVVLLLSSAAVQMLGAAEPAGAGAGEKRPADLWGDLGSPDQAKAAAAVVGLVGRGEAAVTFLTEKLRGPAEAGKAPLDTKRVAALVKDLDAKGWKAREKAHKELAAMGPAAEPFVREALENEPSMEVKVRIDAILAEWAVRAKSDPAKLRRARAINILARIASTRALQTLVALRSDAVGSERQGLSLPLLNLAARALPPLLDGAGAKAKEGDFAAAARLCEKALAISDKTDHYAGPRIRAILDCIRARRKGQAAPEKLVTMLDPAAAGRRGPPISSRIGWDLARGENLLDNCGFEVRRVQGSWPTRCGVWGGDMATIVSAEQGIKPREGKQMLRFHHCNFRSSGSAAGSQVCQVVDISKYKDAIRAGKVRAFALAHYNRVAGNARTDTLNGVGLLAYSGPQAQHFQLSQRKATIARSSAGIHTDADPATWEKLTVGLRLPKNTDFLVIQLLAAEDVYNNLKGVEFDGHYAESAFVTLVTDEADPPPTGQ